MSNSGRGLDRFLFFRGIEVALKNYEVMERGSVRTRVKEGRQSFTATGRCGPTHIVTTMLVEQDFFHPTPNRGYDTIIEYSFYLGSLYCASSLGLRTVRVSQPPRSMKLTASSTGRISTIHNHYPPRHLSIYAMYVSPADD